MKQHLNCETGNVLFLILIAVALFAALSYAVTNSTRSGGGSIRNEQAKLDQAVIENYMVCISQAQQILGTVRGCSSVSYDPPALWDDDETGQCQVFHPQGGGCSYQDIGVDSCTAAGGDPEELEIGEQCGFIIYAGESGGNRIYTTAADQGTATWDNGGWNGITTEATSTSDGLANTNILVGLTNADAPYAAANLCRALGADWYLPAKAELDLFYDNKDEGALSGTFDESGTYYWSSSEYDDFYARIQRFSDGTQSNLGHPPNTYAVRCARR